MGEIIRRWIGRLSRSAGERHGRQQGQSILLIVFAIIGIFGFVGLAFDLAWVFVEQIRISQAADAAALAGGAELPLESAAQTRALAYLQENGYDYEDSETVRLILNEAVVTDTQISGASEENATTTIWIDTAYGRAGSQADTTSKIRVRIQRRVFMTFMQFIGFRNLPVSGVAEAENVSGIDTVIVFDNSLSMEILTNCYGCWTPPADYTEGDPDDMYPSGALHPLFWSSSSTTVADHCASACLEANYVDHPTLTAYQWNDCNYRLKTDTSKIYAVIEAEEYSSINTSPPAAAGLTYWVLQRNGKNAYYGRDSLGAYISHHPWYNPGGEGPGIDCTLARLQSTGKCGASDTPRADYMFNAPLSGIYYFWIRGDGGQSGGGTQRLFWGVDGSAATAHQSAMQSEGTFTTGAGEDGADGSWSVQRLGNVTLTGGVGVTHTLRIWASTAGFDLDRIYITTDSATLPSAISGATMPNKGRTGSACAVCDPRFLGMPGGGTYGGLRPDCSAWGFTGDLGQLEQFNNLPSIWRDEEPIRTALEAAKTFVGWLDPEFDQIAYVRYSTRAFAESPLQCLRTAGTIGCDAEVITQTVLGPLDSTETDLYTNIGEGLYFAWRLFDFQDPYQCISGTTGTNLNNMACGRPGTVRVIILMTDGVPNQTTGAIGCSSGQTGWPGSEAFAALYPYDSEAAKDCVVLQSDLAAQRGAVVFAISIGDAADRDLMNFISDRHGTPPLWAEDADQLVTRLEEVYKRVYLRLTL